MQIFLSGVVDRMYAENFVPNFLRPHLPETWLGFNGLLFTACGQASPRKYKLRSAHCESSDPNRHYIQRLPETNQVRLAAGKPINGHQVNGTLRTRY